MRKLAGQTRAALLGILFAMVGFSYAVATSQSLSLSADGVGARGVGTSIALDFTNPFVAGAGSDRDLGDAAVGSSIVRYVRAKGGIPPYEFTSTGSPTLKSVIASNATLDLALSGKLAGSLGSTAISASPLRFRVHVKDSAGTNGNVDTEIFRITLDSSGVFKFAISSLSEAVQLRPYVDTLSVINGNAPYTFTASGVTQVGNAQATTLENIGLSLSRDDGTVYGKVVRTGTITFTAKCIDAKGNSARSRDLSQIGQTITIAVLANTIITSDVVTTQMTIKLNTKKADSDAVSYKGIVNVGNKAISSFNGDTVEIRVGGFITPAVALTDKGSFATDKTIKTNTFKGKLSTKGLSAGFAKGDVQTDLGAITGSTVRLAVFVKIGDQIASAEILEFTVKSGGSGQTLTYKLGSGALGGNFLITAVKGSDDKSAASTKFAVQFLANPATGVQGSGTQDSTFEGADAADVSIGSNYANSIEVVESKLKVKSTEKRSSKDPVVTKLALDGLKGKGSVTTGPLLASSTGIQKAGDLGDGNSTNFPLNVTVRNVTNVIIFSGEGSATIFAKKTSYSMKNPNK